MYVCMCVRERWGEGEERKGKREGERVNLSRLIKLHAKVSCISLHLHVFH